MFRARGGGGRETAWPRGAPGIYGVPKTLTRWKKEESSEPLTPEDDETDREAFLTEFEDGVVEHVFTQSATTEQRRDHTSATALHDTKGIGEVFGAHYSPGEWDTSPRTEDEDSDEAPAASTSS